MLYGFGSHHGTHIGSAGRVADIACATAYQNDRLVACHLKTFHKAERHKVPYVTVMTATKRLLQMQKPVPQS